MTHKPVFRLLAVFAMLFFLSSCASQNQSAPGEKQQAAPVAEKVRYLTVVEDEPDTVDFQCTSIYYTIAQNVFNRLVEMENDEEGGIRILPSLAESWEVSEDGRCYTFRLRPGVNFSNGCPLTSADVEYTLKRLLTHPESCNRDIADEILGADALMNGESDELEGFRIIDDLSFSITLEQPFEAFLACLSMPGASILDRETTEAAGDLFGKDPAWTVGTGSYILTEWEAGEGMILTANRDCWEGAPKNDGLDLRFMSDPEEVRMAFEDGVLDVLDLDEVGNSIEFFIHGDIYQERLYKVQRIGIHYVALNESVSPLDDARIRKALQLALNRTTLLDAIYAGRGTLENGIYPHGLYGFNPELPEIPYDPEAAKYLLAQAGYSEGFELTLSVNASGTVWDRSMMKLVASMWEKIGVKTTVEVLEESEFMKLRKSGKLACYGALWTADFNDPDNFVYTFFGNRENTTFRSLCYGREEIMKRVREARTIPDAEERLKEYRELERIIVQEDAAWIPLFSRMRYYVASERIDGIRSSWNGSVKNRYCDIFFK
ncbi:MAG: ABC transporter substrate-binding protein [Clostridia bacterium]|nr:ABC transporter substrate-binding protein [Clostridia bacterium]